MSEGAKVGSIDSIKSFRTALWKFQEAANVALSDAESEVHRVLTWVEVEQDQYWTAQVRKREEMVTRCKEAVRHKQIFKDATGRQQSAVEEMKMLQLAQRKLEEAHQKVVAVRRWKGRLGKELELYRGSVQRLSTAVQADLPVAASKLENIVASLDAYVNYDPTAELSTVGDASATGGSYSPAEIASMTRATGSMPGRPEAQRHDPVDLRKKALTPERRAELELAHPDMRQWNARYLGVEDQKVVEALAVERRGFDAAATLVISRSTWGSDRIFLQRLPAIDKHDTGWFAGPMADDVPVEPVELVRAYDLLAVRPDLRDVLTLPDGYLLTIEDGRITVLLDAANATVIGEHTPGEG